MFATPALSLLDPPDLRAAMAVWESVPSSSRREWDARAAGQALQQATGEALSRLGFARVRLIDRPERFAAAELRRLAASLASQIGFLLPQTYANNRTALIQDRAKSYSSHRTRGHETNAELAFHSDRCDLGLLLYVRPSAAGGRLSIIGYEEASQTLAQVSPGAVARLYHDFPFDLREQRIFPSPEWYLRPILWHSDHGIRGHYIRRFIVDSQRHADCPRLTPEQLTALDEFDVVLGRLRPDRSFAPQPGELLLFDNYKVMHAREAYMDPPAGYPGRLAIRVWVAPFASESLPPFLLPLAGALASGCFRGGVGQGQCYHRQLGRTRRKLESTS